MMKLEIVIDESMIDGIFKLVNPDGSERIFKIDGTEVIDGEDNNPG